MIKKIKKSNNTFSSHRLCTNPRFSAFRPHSEAHVYLWPRLCRRVGKASRSGHGYRPGPFIRLAKLLHQRNVAVVCEVIDATDVIPASEYPAKSGKPNLLFETKLRTPFVLLNCTYYYFGYKFFRFISLRDYFSSAVYICMYEDKLH